ncbi:uncharacterized protein LOC135845687 [Planococcus citri]|uniref:uncharacterized protein LOC135845687 n=1 Tax=Planococcus citri TaxID=170843 RepID=UPI0031F9BFD2
MHLEKMINENRPLIYPTSPATLQQFALTRLALDLCHFKRSLKDCDLENFSYENALRIAVPAGVIKVIDKRVQSVDKKLSKLYLHFRIRKDQKDFKVDFNERYFDSVSYGPDGNICLELTAMKLLSSEALSQREKFGIACMYCFEDDVRRIWPTIAHTSDLRDGCSEEVNRTLVQYWAMKMIGSSNTPRYERIVNWMTLERVCWPAFKYILNEMSSGKHRFIKGLLQKELRYAKYMLPKLNETQMRYVLQRYSVEIITKFVWKEKHLDFVMQVWNLAKDLINVDKFLELLCILCSKSYKCADQSECDKLVHVRIALCEIWITAPNSLKDEIFKSDKVVRILIDLENFDLKNKMECYHHDVTFFLRLFKDMPFESRNSLWIRYWLVFVVRYRAKFLDTFLRLCMTEEEIPRFGETVMLDYKTIKPFLDFLLERQLHQDLIDYLKVCSPNHELFREFLADFVVSSDKWLDNPQFDKFTELSKFIDGCFSDYDEIVSFKSKIFFTLQFQNVLKSRLGSGIVEDMVSITELFLYNELDLINAKRNLLEYWQSYYLKSAKINFNDCKQFLSWCIADTNNVSSSNCNFPVDRVFEIVFLHAVPKLSVLLGPLNMNRSEPEPLMARKLDEFIIVDEFLKWYFVTPEAVRDYKLGRIWRRDIPEVGKVLSVRNESVINDVLSWFFDGDLDQVRYFKKCNDTCIRVSL